MYRHGWAAPISALLLLIAGVVLFTQVLPARSKVELLQSELQSARTGPRADRSAAPVTPPEPGQPLRDLLGQAEDSPAQVRRIAGIARLHGISLPRAQYTSSRMAPSGIAHTDITFSFVAGYPQSRAFIEGVMRALPNVSVDRISFERDRAQGTEAEITLRLTLWRWPAPVTASPGAVR